MSDGISLTHIIGVIIGAALIVGIVAFGMGILNIFIPVIDEGSINNFNGLVNHIQSAMENKDNIVSNFNEGRAFYLVDGVILVGYDYNKDRQHTNCSNEFATKPAQLLNKAGLCLHVEDNANNFDYDKQEPIQCYSFDEKITFLAPNDGKYYGGFGGSSKVIDVYGKQENYEDLFLYGGECDIGEPDLGATKLYLDIYKRGDEVYIYLDEFTEENKERIESRLDGISKLKL